MSSAGGHRDGARDATEQSARAKLARRLIAIEPQPDPRHPRTVELDASKLAADGLNITLDGPRGTERLISLAPSSGVSGKYVSNDEAILLDAHSRAALLLSKLVWTLESGEVALNGNASLLRPAVHLVFPRGKAGTHGEVASGEVSIDGVTVTLDGWEEPIRINELHLRKAGLALDGKGTVAILAEELSVKRAELVIGTTEVAIDSLTLGKVRVTKPRGGHWKVEAQSLEATKMAVDIGDLGVVVEDPAVGRVSWQAGGNMSVGELEAPVVHVHHNDLIGRPNANKAPASDKPTRRKKLDLSVLDKLNGSVDVDLTADSTVPVIGTRRATHHFRLKIDHGLTNYYRLEKSLSALEDALLDFVVKGKTLALVVDIPLNKKTIVSWRLDDDEVALAQRRLVRLRRLIDYELPRTSTKKKSKNAIEVRELLFDDIDINLKLSGGASMPLGRGVIHLGTDRKPAVGQLQLTGRVCHRPKGEPVRGRVELSAAKLLLGADNLRVGGQRLALSALRIGAINKAEMRLEGLRPKTLHATLKELALEELLLSRSR